MKVNIVHFPKIHRYGRICHWMRKFSLYQLIHFLIQLPQPPQPLYIQLEYLCIMLFVVVTLGLIVSSICSCWRLGYFLQAPLDLKLPSLLKSWIIFLLILWSARLQHWASLRKFTIRPITHSQTQLLSEHILHVITWMLVVVLHILPPSYYYHY